MILPIVLHQPYFRFALALTIIISCFGGLASAQSTAPLKEPSLREPSLGEPSSGTSSSRAPSSGSLTDPISRTGKDMFTLPDSGDTAPQVLTPAKKPPSPLSSSSSSMNSPSETDPDLQLVLPESVDADAANGSDRSASSELLKPLATVATSPKVSPADSSLRDASITDKDRLERLRTPESELDRELPLHADPQVTRWLVQAAMIEKETTKGRKNENLNKQLKLYEQIITRTCAPSFGRTLTIPTTLPADPACINTLQKIKAINSTNPTAACIEHGIQSSECALYTSQQRVDSAPVSDRDSALYRLTVGTADESAVASYKQLTAQMDKIAKTPLLEITPLQVEAVRKYLSVTCMEYSLATEYLPADKPQATDAAKQALLDQIASMAGKKDPSDKPSETPLRLVRFLPEPCSQTLAMVKKIALPLAAAVCYEQGPMAPNCVQALRNERNSRYASPRSPGTINQKNVSSGSDGLQGF